MLYRHRVQHTRLDVILDRLNTELAGLCGRLPEEVHSELAAAMFRTALGAFERVLTDGGPTRLFVSADMAMVRDDLDSLSELFHAGGCHWQLH